uniref:Uncharacterized protein n=1 Tax=Psilocybe cubensis TaxID=181762 RepID=A0A8H8CDR7_PSICU
MLTDIQMQRQLDEFNRSVTIIIWYKANIEPIRLQQMVPTFPCFQLAQFSNLVTDLGLTSGSYLDTYVPTSNQWEQHTITSVRIVATQQRLLYKLRRSLIDGLSEEECLSLREEVQSQIRNRRESQPPSLPSPPNKTPMLPPTPKASTDSIQHKNSLKRPAASQEDSQDARESPKIHVTNGYYMTHNSGSSALVSSPVAGPSTSTASTSAVSNSQPTTQSQDSNVYGMYQSPVYYDSSHNNEPDNSSSANSTTNNTNTENHSTSDSNSTHTHTLPHYLLAPHVPAAPIPYHPHPPLKRWPNDYTVSELSAGFHSMDMLIAQSPTGANMTQRTAFERVFGSRYVKSTVCRHRAVWRKAPRLLREQFEHMGSDDRACWGEFVRRVENRPPGKHSPMDMMGSPQNEDMNYHDQQGTPEEEEVHGQESVLGTMQNQGRCTCLLLLWDMPLVILTFQSCS